VQLNSLNDFDFVFASPTQSKEEVVIGFDCNNESSVEVNISDAVGKTISSQMLYPKHGFNRMNINIPPVTAGIYFITLANSAFTSSKKIFVN
jgi:hypothetical protein